MKSFYPHNPVLMRSLLAGVLLLLLTASDGAGSKGERNCRPCDVRTCLSVSAYTCNGHVVKDRCGCCPVCVTGLMSDSANTAIEGSQQTETCEEVRCEEYQMCILNMQGLAVCRCPRMIFCRNLVLTFKKSRKSLRVCGDNDVIYKSKCHMQVKSCELSSPIKEVKFSLCMKKKKMMKIAKRRNKRKLRKQRKREKRRKRRKRKDKFNVERKRRAHERRRERKQKRRTLAKLRKVAKVNRNSANISKRARRRRRQNKKMKRRRRRKQQQQRDHTDRTSPATTT